MLELIKKALREQRLVVQSSGVVLGLPGNGSRIGSGRREVMGTRVLKRNAPMECPFSAVLDFHVDAIAKKRVAFTGSPHAFGQVQIAHSPVFEFQNTDAAAVSRPDDRNGQKATPNLHHG
jgi:hypothetical protein